MRLDRYNAPGRPSNAEEDVDERRQIEEFVMLAQAALTIANTERRVLHRDAPKGLGLADSRLDAEANNSYEVTVVDRFFTLSQRAFERRGQIALWERTIPKPADAKERRGSRKSIDISLFHEISATETRLEFGFFSPKKLAADASKLHELRGSLADGYSRTKNYLVLWMELADEKLAKKINDRKKAFSEAAEAANASATGYEVTLRLASGVDVFSESKNKSRVTYVALFEVVSDGSASGAGKTTPSENASADEV